MKKIFTTVFATLLVVSMNAQTQIDNSGFENWESVPGGSEPVNWNSFLTANGALSQFANEQIEESTDVRPGSSGSKSVRIFSKEILSVVANGNITLGRIHMGSTQATDPSNYNKTVRSDADFNQPMTDLPDSIVFWVKFKPNGGSDKARMKATIHDDYDYRDPEDANASDHVVGKAEINYSSTNNSWVRKAVKFDYSGPATDPHYILVTFTTNKTPGGGSGGDQAWIDDVELIYNPSSSVNELNPLEAVSVFPNPTDGHLNIDNLQQETKYAITTVLGKTVKSGELTKNNTSLNINSLRKGTYFIQFQQGENISTKRVIKL